MANKKKKHRGKLFIDGQVQGTLARRILFHWVSLAFCLFLLTAAVQVLQSPFDPPGEHARKYFAENTRVFLVLALLTPAFVWDSIKVSNRFAGPVYRLRTSLDQLAKGEPVPPIKFREGDFWIDLADKFNQVRSRLIEAEAAAKSADDCRPSDTDRQELAEVR